MWRRPRSLCGQRFGVTDGLIDDVVAWWTEHQHRPVPPIRTTGTTPTTSSRMRCGDACGLKCPGACSCARPTSYPGLWSCGCSLTTSAASRCGQALSVGLLAPRSGWRRFPSAADLRARVEGWVEEYTESIGGPYERFGEQWALDHDIRGHALSRELQDELGEGYRVEHELHSRAGREALFPIRRVAAQPFQRRSRQAPRAAAAPPRANRAAWLAQRPRFDHVSDDEREEFFAWEDEGRLIRHELQGAWGVPRVDYR